MPGPHRRWQWRSTHRIAGVPGETGNCMSTVRHRAQCSCPEGALVRACRAAAQKFCIAPWMAVSGDAPQRGPAFMTEAWDEYDAMLHSDAVMANQSHRRPWHAHSSINMMIREDAGCRGSIAAAPVLQPDASQRQLLRACAATRRSGWLNSATSCATDARPRPRIGMGYRPNLACQL